MTHQSILYFTETNLSESDLKLPTTEVCTKISVIRSQESIFSEPYDKSLRRSLQTLNKYSISKLSRKANTFQSHTSRPQN